MSRLFSVLIILILSSTSLAQVTGSADATTKIDKLFAQWDKTDSPGCALAVIKDGQTIYRRGYGMANLDSGIPITFQTVFNVGSISKQFTAMSIILLARQGRLSLDDDIRKYLPEMPRYRVAITIRQLIYHTSGIREYSHLMQLKGIRFQDASDEEVFKIIARQKELNFKPGDQYLYSNSGYFLLAQIVKRASGKSLREYSEENVFMPLGMVNTRFHDDPTEVIRNRATGYAARRDGGFAVETTRSAHVGDGGLLTTIEDLSKWDTIYSQNKLSGGQDLVTQFLTPGTLNSGKKIDYAFGLDVETYRGLKAFSHGGTYNGFSADMIRFQDQRLTVVCLCNLFNIESARLTRNVADIYLANEFKQTAASETALPEPKVIQVPEKELTAVAGSYFNSASNNFRRLYVKDGKLVYSRGSSESELAPLGNNRFLMLGVPDRIEISFQSPRPGAPLQMSTALDGKVFIVHDAVKPASYTPLQLKEFTGTFYSGEIEATYSIDLKDDKLVLRRKNVDGETPLVLQFADAFAAAGTGTLRFTRDGKHRVSGFLLSTNRVRNLRFDKTPTAAGLVAH